MVDKAFEAYGFMFKLRENANSLLLSRISILIIIQAAIISFLANTFDSFVSSYSGILVIVEIFGLVASLFMVYLVRSSIFWLNYWDGELKEIEGDALGKISIFRKHPYINDERKDKLGNGKSTRSAILFFAIAFSIVWLILLAYTLLTIF